MVAAGIEPAPIPQPSVTVCPSTVRSELNPSPSPFACNSRYCPACGDRWQKDMKVMALTAGEHVPEAVGLFTVTAPGDAYFEDPEWRVIGGRPVKERWWNAEARENWTRLHRDASRGPRQYAQQHGEWWGGAVPLVGVPEAGGAPRTLGGPDGDARPGRR